MPPKAPKPPKSSDAFKRALNKAASTGDLAGVRRLLQEGADPNASLVTGETALHKAAAEGHAEVVKELLRAGAHSEACRERDMETPLLTAVIREQVGAARALLAGGAWPDPRRRRDGMTPLMICAQRGGPRDVELVQCLLAARADVNKTEYGGGALYRSVLQGSNVALLEALLAAGADPNCVVDRGRCVLYVAAHAGYLAAVERLLAAGARPDGPRLLDGSSGFTPLAIAAQRNHVEVVKALLAAGANPSLRSRESRLTPLMIAVELGHIDVVRELLADKAIDPDQVAGRDGLTPAIAAAFHGRRAVLEALLLSGATTSKRVEMTALSRWRARCEEHELKDEVTPLYAAAFHKMHECVEVLIAAGADVNVATPRFRRTPLMAAAEGGVDASVAALLAAGADINAVGSWAGKSHTALSCAACMAHPTTVALLLSSGADVKPPGVNMLTACATLFGNLGDSPDTKAKQMRVITVLLEAGADPNLPDSGMEAPGDTPLHALARASRDVSLAALLLRHGADPNVRNKGGMTPLLLLCSIDSCLRSDRYSSYPLSAGGLDTSLAYQLDYERRYRDVASRDRRDIELLQLLLDHGADPNAVSTDGEMALTAACSARREALVRALLDAPSVDVRTPAGDSGKSALHVAAQRGMTAIVEALVARGADVNARMVHGSRCGRVTPLALACLPGGACAERIEYPDQVKMVRIMLVNGTELDGHCLKSLTASPAVMFDRELCVLVLAAATACGHAVERPAPGLTWRELPQEMTAALHVISNRRRPSSSSSSSSGGGHGSGGGGGAGPSDRLPSRADASSPPPAQRARTGCPQTRDDEAAACGGGDASAYLASPDVMTVLLPLLRPRDVGALRATSKRVCQAADAHCMRVSCPERHVQDVLASCFLSRLGLVAELEYTGREFYLAGSRLSREAPGKADQSILGLLTACHYTRKPLASVSLVVYAGSFGHEASTWSLHHVAAKLAASSCLSRHLQTLRVFVNGGVPLPWSSAFEQLARCPGLRHLVLYGFECRIGSKRLASGLLQPLGAMTQLHSLQLRVSHDDVLAPPRPWNMDDEPGYNYDAYDDYDDGSLTPPTDSPDYDEELALGLELAAMQSSMENAGGGGGGLLPLLPPFSADAGVAGGGAAGPSTSAGAANASAVASDKRELVQLSKKATDFSWLLKMTQLRIFDIDCCVLDTRALLRAARQLPHLQELAIRSTVRAVPQPTLEFQGGYVRSPALMRTAFAYEPSPAAAAAAAATTASAAVSQPRFFPSLRRLELHNLAPPNPDPASKSGCLGDLTADMPALECIVLRLLQPPPQRVGDAAAAAADEAPDPNRWTASQLESIRPPSGAGSDCARRGGLRRLEVYEQQQPAAAVEATWYHGPVTGSAAAAAAAAADADATAEAKSSCITDGVLMQWALQLGSSLEAVAVKCSRNSLVTDGGVLQLAAAGLAQLEVEGLQLLTQRLVRALLSATLSDDDTCASLQRVQFHRCPHVTPEAAEAARAWAARHAPEDYLALVAEQPGGGQGEGDEDRGVKQRECNAAEAVWRAQRLQRIKVVAEPLASSRWW